MTTQMSPRGQQLLRAMAANLRLVAEHDKVAPHEVDAIVSALVSHVRNWRPHLMHTTETL